jgi:acetolactate synthase-1/2/3 large subunit
MAKKSESSESNLKPVNRRGFLKGAAAGAALAVAKPGELGAKAAEPVRVENATAPVMPRPETLQGPIAVQEGEIVEKPNSDFMVDVIKSLEIDYVFSVPANTFGDLHESIINYGNNVNPEFVLATNEDAAAAMCHGYYKAALKPAMTVCHSTVGTQHASMGIYDAFCDRVPMFAFLGNIFNAEERGNGAVAWVHSAQDPAAMIRDYVKWDDAPHSLTHFAESVVRAYKIAMTPPMMPVAIALDEHLQAAPIPASGPPPIPKFPNVSAPAGEIGAVRELARMLVDAEHPVIIADRVARTPAGMAHLVELAETLQAAVLDRNNRMNFPTAHHLEQSRSRMGLNDADLILGLENLTFAGVRSGRPNARKVSINSNDLFQRSNYQDFMRYADTDLAIAADAEATLPTLIEEVKRLVTGDRQRVFDQRGTALAAAHKQATENDIRAASVGWNDSPISTARVSMELWPLIKDLEWSLVADLSFFQWWPLRLWEFDKHHQYLGGPGGYGVGYGAPAAVGAALGNKDLGRISINIQNDGDLLMGPAALWTAANMRLPLLNIMHNNQAFHQEVMVVQQAALRHGRDATRAHIGTRFIDPPIDYAKMADSMGIYAEGPILDPGDLGPALSRAVEVVKRGEPAMVDVRTQPR